LCRNVLPKVAGLPTCLTKVGSLGSAAAEFHRAGLRALQRWAKQFSERRPKRWRTPETPVGTFPGGGVSRRSHGERAAHALRAGTCAFDRQRPQERWARCPRHRPSRLTRLAVVLLLVYFRAPLVYPLARTVAISPGTAPAARAPPRRSSPSCSRPELATSFVVHTRPHVLTAILEMHEPAGGRGFSLQVSASKT
jgi:hypothetical protein